MCGIDAGLVIKKQLSEYVICSQTWDQVCWGDRYAGRQQQMWCWSRIQLQGWR